MATDDAQMRDILDTKEYLMRKADECSAELENIQRCIDVVDSMIKKSSFSRASDLHKVQKQAGFTPKPTEAAPKPVIEQDPNAQPIMVNSEQVASVSITPDELRITMGDSVKLTSDTPPLRTFFVDRIIGSMKTADAAQVQGGKLDESSVISCDINEDDHIHNITIRNYRDKARAEEITKSITWLFSRMLENSARQ